MLKTGVSASAAAPTRRSVRPSLAGQTIAKRLAVRRRSAAPLRAAAVLSGRGEPLRDFHRKIRRSEGLIARRAIRRAMQPETAGGSAPPFLAFCPSDLPVKNLDLTDWPGTPRKLLRFRLRFGSQRRAVSTDVYGHASDLNSGTHPSPSWPLRIRAGAAWHALRPTPSARPGSSCFLPDRRARRPTVRGARKRAPSSSY
jgi:hypothetical protein